MSNFVIRRMSGYSFLELSSLALFVAGKAGNKERQRRFLECLLFFFIAGKAGNKEETKNIFVALIPISPGTERKISYALSIDRSRVGCAQAVFQRYYA